MSLSIFFHNSFLRINWTLSSWLMCSGSLLDLNQLYRSRVKTTGAWDGRSQMNGEGKRRGGKAAQKLSRRQQPTRFARRSNSAFKLKCADGDF